jgi:hypothetical protein
MALIGGTKVGSRGTQPDGSARLCGDPVVSGPRRLTLPGHGCGHDVRGARSRGSRAGGWGRRGLGTSAWLPDGKEDGADPSRQRRDRDDGHDGQLLRG